RVRRRDDRRLAAAHDHRRGAGGGRRLAPDDHEHLPVRGTGGRRACGRGGAGRGPGGRSLVMTDIVALWKSAIPRRYSGRYIAGPNQVPSASVSPASVPSPTHATWPSGRKSTAAGAATVPSTGSSHGPA